MFDARGINLSSLESPLIMNKKSAAPCRPCARKNLKFLSADGVSKKTYTIKGRSEPSGRGSNGYLGHSAPVAFAGAAVLIFEVGTGVGTCSSFARSSVRVYVSFVCIPSYPVQSSFTCASTGGIECCYMLVAKAIRTAETYVITEGVQI